MAELAGARENERGKFQSGNGDGQAAIAINSTEQLGHLFGIGQGRVVLGLAGPQGAAQIRGRITFGAPGRYPVAEDLAAKRLDSVGGLNMAAFLDAAQAGQQFSSGDLGKRSFAEDWKGVALESSAVTLVVIRHDVMLVDPLQPFLCHQLERVGCYLLSEPALETCLAMLGSTSSASCSLALSRTFRASARVTSG